MDKRFEQEVERVKQILEVLRSSTESEIKFSSCLSSELFEVSFAWYGEQKVASKSLLIVHREWVGTSITFTLGLRQYSSTVFLGAITLVSNLDHTKIVFRAEPSRRSEYLIYLDEWLEHWLRKTTPYFETKILHPGAKTLIVKYLSQYVNIENEIWTWAKAYPGVDWDVCELESSELVKHEGYSISKIDLTQKPSVIEKLPWFSRQNIFELRLTDHQLSSEFRVFGISIKFVSVDGWEQFQPMMEDLANHLAGCYEQQVWVCEETPAQMLKPDAPLRSTGITTEKTIERANLFKKIKDKNPRLSYTGVAMKAASELNEEITKEDVRNAYRAMDWKWERGDRVS